MTFPRFNIAALPVEPKVEDAFYRAADSLRPLAKGYCLERGKALPHVTLCQFRARDEAQAARLAEKYVGAELLLRHDGLYLPERAEEGHRGKIWVWRAVAREAALINMQAEVVVDLQSEDIDIFQRSGDGFFPHTTLALVDEIFAAPLDRHALYPPVLDGACAYRVGVGRSDEIGQFLGKLGGPS